MTGFRFPRRPTLPGRLRKRESRGGVPVLYIGTTGFRIRGMRQFNAQLGFLELQKPSAYFSICTGTLGALHNGIPYALSTSNGNSVPLGKKIPKNSYV
ncbi:MAG: hypothetical protein AAGA86_05465 [Bacteroidota bacterium]